MVQGMFQWNPNWDGKENLRSDNRVFRHIYLVRHGKYLQNSEGHEILSPIGMRQATVTGRRLQHHMATTTSLFHSPLRRAVETTNLMVASLESIPHTPSELLSEGTLENKEVSSE